jgi:hypothetical protein
MPLSITGGDHVKFWVGTVSDRRLLSFGFPNLFRRKTHRSQLDGSPKPVLDSETISNLTQLEVLLHATEVFVAISNRDSYAPVHATLILQAKSNGDIMRTSLSNQLPRD